MPEWLKKITSTDIRNIISICYVFLALGYIYVLLFKPVPEINKDIINILGGVIMSGVGLILSYYYGSSKTNQNK